MLATKADGEALEVGALIPKEKPLETLETGQIGYVVTNLKSVAEARVGDTITLSKDPASESLAGYQEVKPFVYAGLYPDNADDYPQLKDALSRLKLSDAALIWQNESSAVLGNGFRVGFLGLLHMEIVKERLERDNNLELIVTNPSTDYQVLLTTGEELELRSASDLPNPTQITEIREPWIKGEIVVPKDYLGKVLELIVAAP